MTLADAEAPRFVVLRCGAADAAEALQEYLVEIGTVTAERAAVGPLAGAAVERVGVVW